MGRIAADALPTRFRFASSDGARASDDLAATLQARMRVITIVGVVILLAVSVNYSVRMRSLRGDALASMRVGLIANSVVVPPLALVVWWLRQSRPRAIRWLRWLEIGFFLAFSVFFALQMTSDFPSIVPVLETAPLDLGSSLAVWMSFLIVSYGLLIPNRWQRTASMIALMLGLVVVVDV
jgi:hypothetical protein